MVTVGDSARIPPELAAFRASLASGDAAAGLPADLQATVNRAKVAAEIEADVDRVVRLMEAEDARVARVTAEVNRAWRASLGPKGLKSLECAVRNYADFERMVRERPHNAPPKRFSRKWDLRGGRVQASQTQITTMSPQDVFNRGDDKWEW